MAQFDYAAVVADEARNSVHVLTEARRFGVPTGDLTHRSFPDGCVFSRVFGPTSTSEQGPRRHLRMNALPHCRPRYP